MKCLALTCSTKQDVPFLTTVPAHLTEDTHRGQGLGGGEVLTTQT